MANLLDKYRQEVAPKLKTELKLGNILAVPRLLKITLNVGVKEALTDKKVIDKVVEEIGLIAGQRPVVKKAKKAIAGFKLRQGDPIGVMATLRAKKMYDFFEKLVKIVLPRVRDFRGVAEKSFDQQGNFSLGFSEQIVFAEIDYDKIGKIRGLEVNITTSAKTPQEGKRLLELLGMPFKAS
ncbi:50S ribosomal protein L5 [Candidatus Gottesmanbacteria bacterium]|nr:50S ribosomal protein L5 [Candidatus Gottesmanbacteria bacterium]